MGGPRRPVKKGVRPEHPRPRTRAVTHGPAPGIQEAEKGSTPPPASVLLPRGPHVPHVLPTRRPRHGGLGPDDPPPHMAGDPLPGPRRRLPGVPLLKTARPSKGGRAFSPSGPSEGDGGGSQQSSQSDRRAVGPWGAAANPFKALRVEDVSAETRPPLHVGTDSPTVTGLLAHGAGPGGSSAPSPAQRWRTRTLAGSRDRCPCPGRSPLSPPAVSDARSCGDAPGASLPHRTTGEGVCVEHSDG